jgi:hypothetical protein
LDDRKSKRRAACKPLCGHARARDVIDGSRRQLMVATDKGATLLE